MIQNIPSKLFKKESVKKKKSDDYINNISTFTRFFYDASVEMETIMKPM